MEWRSARGAQTALQARIPPLKTAPNKTNKIFHVDQYHLLDQLQISIQKYTSIKITPFRNIVIFCLFLGDSFLISEGFR